MGRQPSFLQAFFAIYMNLEEKSLMKVEFQTACGRYAQLHSCILLSKHFVNNLIS